MKKIGIWIGLLLCGVLGTPEALLARSGRNYYVDATKGSDAADGKTPATAWKTLSKVETITLSAGDSLLFCRGGVYEGQLEVTGKGKPGQQIVVGAYGEGSKPCIKAPDSSLYAILVKNADYLTLQQLEVVNQGSKPMPWRAGVKVLCEDYGISHDIVLDRLYIHDVNGSLIKQKGGGSGILVVNKGGRKLSAFDGLTIEHCVIRRCQRNGMIWMAYSDRKQWYPNKRVVVRYNLIEEVPGDGIVPIGCDGAVICYNKMCKSPGTLPHSEAAAGIWPWSCDNTLIEQNEVSDHKAPWDAQGFDSDYNCNHTTIQYNYSHDNDGGMVLICNSGTYSGAETMALGCNTI